MQCKVELIHTGDTFEIIDSRLETAVVGKKRQFIDLKNSNSLEIFLTSVGICAGAHAKRYLKRHNIFFSKLNISINAHLSRELPMSLKDINVDIDTDADTGDQKEAFERFIHGCPVHNTLLHTKEINITLK